MHEIPLHSYEFFGSGARLELQQKMARLAPVLERTPGVLNIWRGLGIEAGSGYSIREIEGIVREFGMTVILFLTDEETRVYSDYAKRANFECHAYTLLESHDDTEDVCARLARERPLPEGWREVRIDHETPPELVAAFQQLSDHQGVAASPGCLLRGLICEFVSLMYLDEKDTPAAVAFVGDRHHGDSPFTQHFFAGGAAVGTDYRGLGLGASIFARAIHYTYQSFDVKNVHAAVKVDNLPSTRMCERAGLTDQNRRTVILLDQEKFGDGYTR
jgi:RimJ/RimL family protein N-acetyltransferase